MQFHGVVVYILRQDTGYGSRLDARDIAIPQLMVRSAQLSDTHGLDWQEGILDDAY